MFILIAGAGKVGRYLATNLSEIYEISTIDIDDKNLSQLEGLKNITTFKGDATDPKKLEEAGVLRADIVAAVTGFDESNLVISQLAKQVYRVPRVIARVNDPRNQWLFTKQWGVDVAISSPQIMLQLISEEMSFGEIITLLKLKVGELSLIEINVPEYSLARGHQIKDLGLPPNAVIVAILRDASVIVPHGGTTIEAKDSLLMVTKPELEREIRKILAA